MNKKIKLFALISAPILIGGGFAALTLVNQCSKKPGIHFYNLTNYIEENISGYFAPGAPINEGTVKEAAYSLAKNNFKGMVSKDDFDANTEILFFSTDNKNCKLKAIDGSTLLSGYIPLTWDSDGFNMDGTNWVGHISGTLTTYTEINGDVIIRSCGASNEPYTATDLVIPGIVIDNNNVSHKIVGIDAGAFSNGLIKYKSYTNLSGSLTVGNNVNVIDMHAFDLCSNINAVTIPSSVSRINSDAFADVGASSSISSITLTLVGFKNQPTNWGTGSFSGFGYSKGLNANILYSINGSWDSRNALDYLETSSYYGGPGLDSDYWTAK